MYSSKNVNKVKVLGEKNTTGRIVRCIVFLYYNIKY